MDPPDNVDREVDITGLSLVNNGFALVNVQDALKLFNINVIGMAKVTQASGVLRPDKKGGKVNTRLSLAKIPNTGLSLVNTLR